MIRFLLSLGKLVAGVALFAYLLAGAVDQELASGGVLTEREKPGATPVEQGTRPKVGSAYRRAQASSLPSNHSALIGGAVDGPLCWPCPSRSVSACGASSIGPDGRVTVTSCGERLSERADYGTRPDVPKRLAPGLSAENVGTQAQQARSESLYQGKPVRWWARRAVQNKKDSLARGRTIRRLQTAARTRLAYPTGHWLDGAFLCIHRYERGAAGWQTATGNGYRGGLQFDSSFARAYGPAWAFRAFGNVERWPASVQIAAAVQAWTTRGFGPWPSTRRMCGL